MILSKRAELGGVQLDEIDESIVIRGTDPGTPQQDAQTAEKMGAWGSRLTGTHRGPLKATVAFAIDIPKTRMSARGDVFDRVTAWAMKKGWLVFPHLNKGRRMYVERAVMPGREDLWDWTRDYTIELWNYSVPFWETKSGATGIKNIRVPGGGATGSTAIEIDGTAESVLEVTFKNNSGKTINDVSVGAGGNTMTLAGVNLAANETLIIDHRQDGTLRARAVVLSSSGAVQSSRSVYGLITGADDLTVNPGRVTVSVSATRAGILTVENYARWL